MSEIMREFGLEQRKDAENSILLKLIKKGLSPEYISSLLEIPLERILKLIDLNKNID